MMTNVAAEGLLVHKVEEHLYQRLLDFTRRRDRYLNLSVHHSPLPATTMEEICRRLSLHLALHVRRVSPSLVRVVKLPLRAGPLSPRQLLSFPGVVLYIRRSADAEFCCEILRRSKIPQVGLDTEWKPNRQDSDDDHPTALIQLCFKTPEKMKRGCLEMPTARGAEYTCFLLHVIHHGVSPALKALLSDSTVAKAGVEIDADVQKLKRHYGVEVQSTIELHEEARERRKIATRGLRSLFHATVGYDYPKDKHVTLSNWETAPLSEEQQDYAACDAFAALRIYESLLPPST